MFEHDEQVALYDMCVPEFKSIAFGWCSYSDFFSELNHEFGFTLDACATSENAVCDKYYTIEDNGLEQDWSGEVVYCNPFDDDFMIVWAHKCYAESRNKSFVVMLVSYKPDEPWWTFIEGEEIRRIECRFNMPGTSFHHVDIPIAVVVFGGKK